MIWTDLYLIVLLFVPGAFEGIEATQWREAFSELAYYSFATLTTPGYGDIVPHSHIAEFLASMEAVTGVFLYGDLRFQPDQSPEKRSEKDQSPRIKAPGVTPLDTVFPLQHHRDPTVSETTFKETYSKEAGTGLLVAKDLLRNEVIAFRLKSFLKVHRGASWNLR